MISSAVMVEVSKNPVASTSEFAFAAEDEVSTSPDAIEVMGVAAGVSEVEEVGVDNDVAVEDVVGVEVASVEGITPDAISAVDRGSAAVEFPSFDEN